MRLRPRLPLGRRFRGFGQRHGLKLGASIKPRPEIILPRKCASHQPYMPFPSCLIGPAHDITARRADRSRHVKAPTSGADAACRHRRGASGACRARPAAPAWTPEPGAAVARYRSPRYVPHPGQLKISFDQAEQEMEL